MATKLSADALYIAIQNAISVDGERFRVGSATREDILARTGAAWERIAPMLDNLVQIGAVVVAPGGWQKARAPGSPAPGSLVADAWVKKDLARIQRKRANA